MIKAKKREIAVSPYVYTGYHCNNNCIFCSEADDYLERFGNKSFEQIKKEILRVRKKYDFVSFMGREPTLRNDIFDILKFAKKCGFRQVGLTTNGRMLSYEDFAKQILATGVNQIGFSLSGSSAAVHDRQTKVRGSFRQTLRGIYNISRFKKPEVSLLVNLTINKTNYQDLKKMMDLLLNLKVREINILYIAPLSMRSRTRNIVMKMSGLGRHVFNTIKPYLNHPLLKILLVEFLPCSMPKEARVHFFPCLEKNSHKVRIPLCKKCPYKDKCDGILSDYINLYGTGEFNL